MIHILTTCTDRKHLPVPPQLRLRNIPHGPADERAERWAQLLSTYTGAEATHVRQLYAGDHWTTSLSLERDTRKLWVISAGYGLVSVDDRALPYSATFAPGHPDSIMTGKNSTGSETAGLEAWWRGICSARRQYGNTPFSISEFARKHSKDTVLIIASKTYLMGLEDDVLGSGENLEQGGGQLLIVSAGLNESSLLQRYSVGGDARLQPLVGGARQALNARIARHLLDRTSDNKLNRESLRSKISRLMEGREIERYDRKASRDDEVCKFISRALRENPSACHSPLLREYRDSGRACEQARFRKLFQQLVKDND